MGNLARTAGKAGARPGANQGGSATSCKESDVSTAAPGVSRDLAFVAGAAGEFERAVKLLGAADALRERTGIVIPTPSVQIIERTLSDSQNALGKEVFAAAWDKGMAMSLPHATAYALGQSGSARPRLLINSWTAESIVLRCGLVSVSSPHRNLLGDACKVSSNFVL